MLKTIVYFSIFFVACFHSAIAQDTTQKLILERLEKIEESAQQKIKFGLSFGPRVSLQQDRIFVRSASISPVNSKLQLQYVEIGEMVLSASILAFPFASKTNNDLFGKNFGFFAKVNLIDFTANYVDVFNRIVEGGIGFCYQFDKTISVGLCYELLFSKKLIEGYQNGDVIKVNDKPLTSISLSDTSFFYDSNRSAISLVLIFTF